MAVSYNLDFDPTLETEPLDRPGCTPSWPLTTAWRPKRWWRRRSWPPSR